LDAAKTTASVNSDEKKLSAVNIAFDFSGSTFEWMAKPGEAYRGKRMGEAMQQLHKTFNALVSEGIMKKFSALKCGLIIINL
jgi:hypothetical protein